MEEINPVKEYLFNYIKKSKTKFQKLFSQTQMNEIINDIVDNCFDEVASIGNKEESLGVFATGILHYMLTNAQIGSQRKVESKDIEIDIIIPDMKTLEKDPEKTLIISIPNTSDKKIIDEKLKKLQEIQPEKQNIWLVLTTDLKFDVKTYIIQKKKSSFSNIIFDIAQFANVQGYDKFKILRI